MADIIVKGGIELPANTLFYPPDNDLLGGKPTDWAGNLLPVSELDARMRAMQTGQPLYNSQTFDLIQPAFPLLTSPGQPTGTAPPQTVYQPVMQRNEGFDINGWFSANWKWAVPIGVGILIMALRR